MPEYVANRTAKTTPVTQMKPRAIPTRLVVMMSWYRKCRCTARNRSAVMAVSVRKDIAANEDVE